MADIKAKAEALAQKSQALGGALYAQQAEGAAEQGGAAPEDDGVVDAEVVEDEPGSATK